MSGDHAHTKSLRRLLIAAMALLLVDRLGRYALYAIKHIEQWIAKELREQQRTDDHAEAARSQLSELRWVGNRAGVQARGRRVEQRARSLLAQRIPGLAREQAIQARANSPAQVLHHQAHRPA